MGSSSFNSHFLQRAWGHCSRAGEGDVWSWQWEEKQREVVESWGTCELHESSIHPNITRVLGLPGANTSLASSGSLSYQGMEVTYNGKWFGSLLLCCWETPLPLLPGAPPWEVSPVCFTLMSSPSPSACSSAELTTLTMHRWVGQFHSYNDSQLTVTLWEAIILRSLPTTLRRGGSTFCYRYEEFAYHFEKGRKYLLL